MSSVPNLVVDDENAKALFGKEFDESGYPTSVPQAAGQFPWDPYTNIGVAVVCNPPCLPGIISTFEFWLKVLQAKDSCLQKSFLMGYSAEQCNDIMSKAHCLYWGSIISSMADRVMEEWASELATRLIFNNLMGVRCGDDFCLASQVTNGIIEGWNFISQLENAFSRIYEFGAFIDRQIGDDGDTSEDNDERDAGYISSERGPRGGRGPLFGRSDEVIRG